MNKVFSERLTQSREKKGLSQQQVADALKLSKGKIENYENGVYEPNTGTFALLASFYGISADYLLGLSEDPAPSLYQNTEEDHSYYCNYIAEEHLRNAVEKILKGSDSTSDLAKKLKNSIAIYNSLSSDQKKGNMIENLATIVEMYDFQASKVVQ